MSQFECRNLRANPESVQLLRRLGGYHVYGPQRLRIVWGWDVRDHAKGNMFFRYDVPERWLERFHLEYWTPPGVYGSPEVWSYNGFDETVGPFPRGGDYERLLTFENIFTHEFVDPAPILVEEAIHRFATAYKKTDSELKAKNDRVRETNASLVRAMRRDIIDENTAAFGLSPWMPVSGPMTGASRRTDWRNRL